MRFDGERRQALALEQERDEGIDAFVAAAEVATRDAVAKAAALVYGIVRSEDASAIFARLGWTSLGEEPLLVRPLRMGPVPLLLPFQRGRLPGFREIAVKDPRVSRLWDRFSIDIGVAVERVAAYVGPRVFERDGGAYRAFIFEDGDRYVIRALCIFCVRDDGRGARGHVVELLHDRSVAGMRAASHLLGQALREMSDAGATSAEAWSLAHSGTFPLFVRHAFIPSRASGRRALGVRAFDPEIEHLVTERQLWYLSQLDRESA